MMKIGEAMKTANDSAPKAEEKKEEGGDGEPKVENA
jgi:hypothetical protein